jgi:hypothetical protein
LKTLSITDSARFVLCSVQERINGAGTLKQLKQIIAVFLIGLPFGANADLLFEDDFESGLGQWTNGSGAIVDDPNDPGNNNVLAFTALGSGGDIFSIGAFDPVDDIFNLSFSYLGTCTNPAGNCGGYVGYSDGFPGSHTWHYATGTTSGAADVLIDNGEWRSYSFTFNSARAVHLMIEDFTSSETPGDAYFDDIRLTDGRVSVPEPGTLALFGLGLFGMGLVRRKKAV